MDIKARSLSLKATISTVLSELLGTYTFKNKSQAPAIALLRGMNEPFPPSGTITEGLEAVLLYPMGYPEQMIGGATIQLEWQIFLKQWDGNGTTAIAQIKLVEALNYEEGIVKRAFTSPASAATGTPEVCRVLFSEYLGV